MGADTSQALLCADGVSMRYGDQRALQNIDLSVNAGETVGLLGLNGAGKSTLLKILSGVLTTHQGQVSIAGASLSHDPVNARRQLGYAPDTPPLYPEFRVDEFLRFAAKLRRLKGSEANRAVARVIELCQLGDVQKRVIGNLSHGYQQRINLAQAMVHQPALLILDEPTNGLDPAQLLEIRSLIKNLGSEQATIFSSHQLAEVQANCQRVVLIDAGRKIMDLGMDQLTDDNYSTVEVRLTQAASDSDFQHLPGFVAACAVNPKHWLLTTLKGRDSAVGDSALGDVAVRDLTLQGVKPLRITPVGNHLETLFSLLRVKTDTAGEAT